MRRLTLIALTALSLAATTAHAQTFGVKPPQQTPATVTAVTGTAPIVVTQSGTIFDLTLQPCTVGQVLQWQATPAPAGYKCATITIPDVPDEVVRVTTAPTGAAPTGAKLAVDTTTNQVTHYVTGAGVWAAITPQAIPDEVVYGGVLPPVGTPATGAKLWVNTATNTVTHYANAAGTAWVAVANPVIPNEILYGGVAPIGAPATGAKLWVNTATNTVTHYANTAGTAWVALAAGGATATNYTATAAVAYTTLAADSYIDLTLANTQTVTLTSPTAVKPLTLRNATLNDKVVTSYTNSIGQPSTRIAANSTLYLLWSGTAWVEVGSPTAQDDWMFGQVAVTPYTISPDINVVSLRTGSGTINLPAATAANRGRLVLVINATTTNKTITSFTRLDGVTAKTTIDPKSVYALVSNGAGGWQEAWASSMQGPDFWRTNATNLPPDVTTGTAATAIARTGITCFGSVGSTCGNTIDLVSGTLGLMYDASGSGAVTLTPSVVFDLTGAVAQTLTLPTPAATTARRVLILRNATAFAKTITPAFTGLNGVSQDFVPPHTAILVQNTGGGNWFELMRSSHRLNNGNVLTAANVTLLGGAGVGASVSSILGGDLGFTLTITAGAAPYNPAAGMANITLSSTINNITPRAVCSPSNAAASTLNMFGTGSGDPVIQVGAPVAPTALVQYSISCIVFGRN